MPFKAIVTASSLCIGKQRGPLCVSTMLCVTSHFCVIPGDGKRETRPQCPSGSGALWTLLTQSPGQSELGKQLQTPSPWCSVVGARDTPSGVTWVRTSLLGMADCQVPLPSPSPLLLPVFRDSPQVRAEKTHSYHLFKHSNSQL